MHLDTVLYENNLEVSLLKMIQSTGAPVLLCLNAVGKMLAGVVQSDKELEKFQSLVIFLFEINTTCAA